jgi:hypothetical protein
MALTSRFTSSSPEGKTTASPSRADRLAAQAATLAAKRPTQTSVERMEQTAAIPAAVTLAASPSADAATATAEPVSPAGAVSGVR